MENKKIYFAGSIRAGRVDAERYHRMIAFIKQSGTVLTEHVGESGINLQERGREKDAAIYRQDTQWLSECDLLIAECTSPSLGVGYELAFAEKLGKPCYIFYDKNKTQLSAMLTGDPYFNIFPYENEEELFSALDRILRG